MYDERFVTPMRQELTRLGIEEMRTPEEVDAKLKDAPGTTLVVVNSVCGCAARNARPAVAEAIRHSSRPDHLTTVFAGQDAAATQRARGYFTGYPPSSPQIALLKAGAGQGLGGEIVDQLYGLELEMGQELAFRDPPVEVGELDLAVHHRPGHHAGVEDPDQQDVPGHAGRRSEQEVVGRLRRPEDRPVLP